MRVVDGSFVAGMYNSTMTPIWAILKGLDSEDTIFVLTKSPKESLKGTVVLAETLEEASAISLRLGMSLGAREIYTDEVKFAEALYILRDIYEPELLVPPTRNGYTLKEVYEKTQVVLPTENPKKRRFLNLRDAKRTRFFLEEHPDAGVYLEVPKSTPAIVLSTQKSRREGNVLYYLLTPVGKKYPWRIIYEAINLKKEKDVRSSLELSEKRVVAT